MKVYINDMVFDTNTVPVILTWDTDEERIKHGKNIMNMPNRKGKRAYAEFPNDYNVEKVNNMIDAAVGNVTPSPDIEG